MPGQVGLALSWGLCTSVLLHLYICLELVLGTSFVGVQKCFKLLAQVKFDHEGLNFLRWYHTASDTVYMVGEDPCRAGLLELFWRLRDLNMI